MKIELLHIPGCRTYKKIKNILESIVAEERLPIAIETTESEQSKILPMVKIDGREVNDSQSLSLRELLCNTILKRWYEIYEEPLKQY